jgi:hypothetical protein
MLFFQDRNVNIQARRKINSLVEIIPIYWNDLFSHDGFNYFRGFDATAPEGHYHRSQESRSDTTNVNLVGTSSLGGTGQQVALVE